MSYINTDDFLELFAVASAGQDKQFINTVETVLENTPAAANVAEVKHRKWDINRNCSVCGVYKFEGLDADVWADWDIDYCPHCGAKMDGKDGE